MKTLRQTPGAVADNKMLSAGIFVLAVIVLGSVIGSAIIDHELAEVGTSPPSLPPRRENILGTDAQGRDVLADVILGTPATFKIGLMAGLIGVALGTVLAFTGGYIGGLADTAIRLLADVFLTVPSLLILVVVASTLRAITDVPLSIEAMGFLVASFAWMYPTRTIRAQVLSLRERGFVQVAKLNGMGNLEIIWKELFPNLLPYIAASLVGTIAAAILVAIGLSTIGLGPQNDPSLGLTIYWMLLYGALLRNMWWWWATPMVIIVLLFIGLYLTAAGLDQIANPRLRGF